MLINLDQLPDRRVVVHFCYHDVAWGRRHWWLVLARPEPELCLTDPGFAVDLTVRTDPVTMASVWVGDMELSSALRCERIMLEGPAS